MPLAPTHSGGKNEGRKEEVKHQRKKRSRIRMPNNYRKIQIRHPAGLTKNTIPLDTQFDAEKVEFLMLSMRN